MRLDLPAPVGPERANSSVVGEVHHRAVAEGGEALELQAFRPHASSSPRATRSNSARASQGVRRSSASSEVLAEQLEGARVPAGGPVAASAPRRGRPGGRRQLDADVDRVGEAGADLVDQPGPVVFPDDEAEVGVAAAGDERLELRQGAGEGAQPARRRCSSMASSRAGRPACELDDHRAGLVVALTEVELQRRARVVGRRRPVDALVAVEVTERDVAGGGREDRGRHGVVEHGVRGPFAAAHRAARRR